MSVMLRSVVKISKIQPQSICYHMKHKQLVLTRKKRQNKSKILSGKKRLRYVHVVMMTGGSDAAQVTST